MSGVCSHHFLLSIRGSDKVITFSKYKKPIDTETNEKGCTLVVGKALNRDGYAVIWIDGIYHLAHRVSYEQSYGKISEGLVVRHKCDNPRCVNPSHLELGTHKDNALDRVKRDRSAKGIDNGRSKLTEDDVLFIRSDNGLNNSQLARMFNVDRKSIRCVKEYKTWTHVS